MDEKNPQIIELTIDESFDGERIDKFLTSHLTGFSRNRIQKLISDEAVMIDGKSCKASAVVHIGDIVVVTIGAAASPHAQTSKLQPKHAQFELLYEDDAVLVINKPAGLVVHPGAGTQATTLVEGVLFHMEQEGEELDLKDGDMRPGVVHRLDKDTTGVMVFAKDEVSHEHLAAQFREKSNLREYVALLDGVLPTTSVIYESYLYRDPRNRLRFASLTPQEYLKLSEEKADLSGYRYAKSSFQVKKVYGKKISLVTIRLFTGRTHQIRVHAKALGASVLGDSLYNKLHKWPPTFDSALVKQLNELGRQMLHARVLGFVHPKSGRKLGFEAALPSDFTKIIDILESYAIQSEKPI